MIRNALARAKKFVEIEAMIKVALPFWNHVTDRSAHWSEKAARNSKQLLPSNMTDLHTAVASFTFQADDRFSDVRAEQLALKLEAEKRRLFPHPEPQLARAGHPGRWQRAKSLPTPALPALPALQLPGAASWRYEQPRLVAEKPVGYHGPCLQIQAKSKKLFVFGCDLCHLLTLMCFVLCRNN